MTDERQWFHCILTLYGAWLNGDPRGFRTRHHREHIEGDYKTPPPLGAYANYERHAWKSLKQTPVILTRDLRPVLGNALREKLEQNGALVVCLAVGGQHVHVLAKIAAGEQRVQIGNAKRRLVRFARARLDRQALGQTWAGDPGTRPLASIEHIPLHSGPCRGGRLGMVNDTGEEVTAAQAHGLRPVG